MEKICPRCGECFNCSHGSIEQCDCVGVVLDANQCAYISKNFDDCLCRACLLEIQMTDLLPDGFAELNQEESNYEI